MRWMVRASPGRGLRLGASVLLKPGPHSASGSSAPMLEALIIHPLQTPNTPNRPTNATAAAQRGHPCAYCVVGLLLLRSAATQAVPVGLRIRAMRSRTGGAVRPRRALGAASGGACRKLRCQGTPWLQEATKLLAVGARVGEERQWAAGLRRRGNIERRAPTRPSRVTPLSAQALRESMTLCAHSIADPAHRSACSRSRPCA